MRRLVAGAVLAFGVGCSLSPKADPSRFYVLAAANDTTVAPPSTASELILGLGPIIFPDYLHRSQMVTRVDDNQVKLSEVHRWAEDIEAGFTRVLAHDLQRTTGADRIRVFPWLPVRHTDYAIEITVFRFERDSTGMVDLWAKWIVRNGETREIVRRQESRIFRQASGTTFSASVEAQSEAVVLLAREIAAAIQ